MLSRTLFLFSSLVCVVMCHSDGHIHAHIDLNTEEGKEHLKQDLHGKTEKDTSRMNFKELQFHYFREHDINDDSRLDGTEIVASLLHHSGDKHFFMDDDVAPMIDDLMRSKDKNDDGLLTFIEYST